MANTPSWQRVCDCRCPRHHGERRTTYRDDDCACTITCATQPTTLLTPDWNCALFLDHTERLWCVTRLPGGQWDWSRAGHIRTDHAAHPASLTIAWHLHQTVALLRDPYQPRHQA